MVLDDGIPRPLPKARGDAGHPKARQPDGVTAAPTGTSQASAGTSGRISPSYSSATTGTPAGTRASARSYEPPPRPSRTPETDTARAGTNTRSTPAIASTP